MWLRVCSNDHAPLTIMPYIIFFFKIRMISSLVAMTGLEKCCITSAYLQWLCHSGERPVALLFCSTKTKINKKMVLVRIAWARHFWVQLHIIQGLFWPQIFVREKIPFGQKQWEIFKFTEIFLFSLARTNWEFFFFFFFVKVWFCMYSDPSDGSEVCISIIIAYFVMYSTSKSG